MVFSSTFFLFLFLPIALAVTLASPRRFRNFSLLFFSCIFYGWFENWSIFLLFAVSLTDYMCGLFIGRGFGTQGPVESLEKEGKRTRTQKAALLFSIISNLAILGFFKYTNSGSRTSTRRWAWRACRGCKSIFPSRFFCPWESVSTRSSR